MNKYMTILGMLGCISTNIALAQNGEDLYDINSISVNTSIGFLGANSKEYVYDVDSGRKISELNWKARNATIIKGDISWDPLLWLTLNARGWTTFSSSKAKMDDFDWQDANQAHWTDWSHSPNTNLNYANELDLNAKTWLIKEHIHKVGAVIGYQQTRFSWTAFGGHYQYNNGNDVGDFPNRSRGIGYQQKFSMPYFGLAGSYRYKELELNSIFKFSPWVMAKDNDEHYMRNLTFREKTGESKFYSASVDVGYYITPKTKLFTELSWSRFTIGKGGSQIIDHANKKTLYEGGESAGIANQNYSVTAGLQYRF
ncbi:omptin family outer membrane protease [Klebsiella variicola]|nr:omptin family outer membrane protease [Klebsiella variicola]